jgi:hypothetical protein
LLEEDSRSGELRNGEQKIIEWSYLGRAQTASALQWAESVCSWKSTFSSGGHAHRYLAQCAAKTKNGKAQHLSNALSLVLSSFSVSQDTFVSLLLGDITQLWACYLHNYQVLEYFLICKNNPIWVIVSIGEVLRQSRRGAWRHPRRASPAIAVCRHRCRWGCGVPTLPGRGYRHDSLVFCRGCLPWRRHPASKDKDGADNDDTTMNETHRIAPSTPPPLILVRARARARAMMVRVAVVVVGQWWFCGDGGRWWWWQWCLCCRL